MKGKEGKKKGRRKKRKNSVMVKFKEKVILFREKKDFKNNLDFLIGF